MLTRDGSLTLYIQHEVPEGGKGAKWIPAPAGQFFKASRFTAYILKLKKGEPNYIVEIAKNRLFKNQGSMK